MRRLAAVIALGAALAPAGCGDDDEGQETVVQTTTVTESAPTTTAPETTTAPDTTTTPEQGGACADAAGNEIQIVTGDVDCSAAQDTAAQYDQQGERVQEVGEWVCEGGNAQTRPVIFTCTGPGGEFIVREAGG